MLKSAMLKKIVTVMVTMAIIVSGIAMPTAYPINSQLILTASASSYTTGNYRVNVSNGVNVRSGANTTHSIKGAATNGTTFNVTQISGSWGYTSSIKCTNGTQSGWVLLSNCAKVTSSYTTGNYKVNVSNGVNVRSGANTTNSIKGAATNGTTFNVTQISGSWGYTSSIKCTNGTQSGWVLLSNCAKVTSSVIVSPTSVSLSSTSKSIKVGSSTQLTATVSPSNATDKRTTWSSSNTSVATVSSTGLVTAKKAGTSTITVKTNTGAKTATCKVTVNATVISPTSVSLSSTSKSLTVGKTTQLTATVYPSNATDKKVTWSSSNTSVATVSSMGIVTAKKAGTSTITVKTSTGAKTAACKLTVDPVIFNSNSINACALLNNVNAVNKMGHNAVLLIDTNFCGVYYSYGPKNTGPFGTGVMTKKLLSPTEVSTLLNNGKVGNDYYTRALYRVTPSTTKGKAMYNEAESLYNKTPPYSVLFQQCDNIAKRILAKGDRGYTVKGCPNSSFNDYEALLKKNGTAFKVYVAK